MDNKVVLAGLLIATIAIAGCTGSTGYGGGAGQNSDNTGGTGDNAGTGDSDSGGQPAVEVVSASPDRTVEMQGTAFQGSPSVQPGTVIRFVNRDSYGHTVTIKTQGIDKQVGGGESVTLRFNKAGSYQIVCTIHPGMQTTVTVEG
ncbi:MAG: cupredoxin domain-containing protein [Candidatus Nanohaloarchaea archaeon]|nr:cupredoxin domain-containing protein [Candidatus Nanohaloarchaea archaeon]